MFLTCKIKNSIGALILMGGALFSTTSASYAQAPVITGTYTSSGGLFSYLFTVVNPLSVSLVDANLTLTTGMLAQNLSAPLGFQTTYDPGLNIVDFTPLAGSAADFSPGSTTAGFRFDSTTFLPSAAYNIIADDAMGTNYNGTVTLSAQTSAPEPSALALLLTSILPLGTVLMTQRRRGARRVSVA